MCTAPALAGLRVRRLSLISGFGVYSFRPSLIKRHAIVAEETSDVEEAVGMLQINQKNPVFSLEIKYSAYTGENWDIDLRVRGMLSAVKSGDSLYSADYNDIHTLFREEVTVSLGYKFNERSEFPEYFGGGVFFSSILAGTLKFPTLPVFHF